MDIRAELVTKTSKSGREYQCVVLYLTDDYTKLIFLDRAEIALVESNR